MKWILAVTSAVTSAVTLALVLTHCSSETPPIAVIADISFADFDRQARHIQCAMIDRCNAGWRFADLAHCDDAPVEGVTTSGWGLNRGMGIVANYGPKYGKPCIAELAQAFGQGCDFPVDSRLRPVGPACARVFAGTLPDGAVCRRDPECASGACVAGCPGVNRVCVPTVGLGAACKPGHCSFALQCERGVCIKTAVPALNESCDERHCPEALSCTRGPSGTSCVARAGVGQPCSRFEPSATLKPTCQVGTVCGEQGENDTGECVTPPAVGEPCGKYGYCGQALDCSADKICVAYLKPGAPCSAGGGCAQIDLQCRDGACAFLPQTGQACAKSPNSNQLRCLPGSFCDPATAMCKPFGAIGQPCSANLECPQPLQCAAGTCRGLGNLGEWCNPWCVEGLKCQDSVCVALRGMGDPCGWHEDCAEGLYCQKGKCIRQADAGQACESWWACGPGTECANGVCSAAACGL